MALLETLRAQLQQRDGRAVSLGEVIREAVREKALGTAATEGATAEEPKAPPRSTPSIAALLVLYRNSDTGKLSLPTRRGLVEVEEAEYESITKSAREVELSDLEARAEEATPKPGSRYVPVDHQLLVAARSGNRCRFPGCAALATEWHHLHPHAEGGTTHADNLVPVCDLHHQAPHSGWLADHRNDPERWRYLKPGSDPEAGGADRAWAEARARKVGSRS